MVQGLSTFGHFQFVGSVTPFYRAFDQMRHSAFNDLIDNEGDQDYDENRNTAIDEPVLDKKRYSANIGTLVELKC